MLFGMNWVHTKLFLTLVFILLCKPVVAQSVNPVDDNVRLKVEAFTLLQADGKTPAQLPKGELQRQILLERARFGGTMSVDELHQVADALTIYVRNLGYVFHSVYLPPQKVEGGLVELRMQKGVLGSVHVINTTSLADERFTRVFDDLLGSTLYGPDVEDRVQALKSQGGFEVFPFYSRGTKAGEARLNLKVDKARQRSFSLKLDNYGSASSGEYRLIGQYSEFQFTGHHDRLAIAILRSVDEVANTYGSLYYNLPFAGLKYAWDISASNNQFEIGDRYASLGLEGDASTVRTGITRNFSFHPKHRSRMRFGLYEKRNNLNADGNAADQEELSRAATLLWSKDKQWQESSAAINLILEFSHGEFEVEGVPDGDFNKLDLSGFWVKGMARGRGRNIWQLSLRGQYSDAALPSVEGFSLTGAYGVRGFEPGGFNADSAVLASLEWRFPTLLSFSNDQSWRLEPYLIGDWATGTKEGLSDGLETDATYSSAGVGLRLNWGKHFMAQLTASNALKGELNGNKVEGDEQVLFEIRWY